MNTPLRDLTPTKIVAYLDRYIIGQKDAKKSVAIALRNRYRRSLLSPEMAEEVAPKNIIMIGPTGVGKTEIARRLAKLTNAPFLKIEATKFTEVGYVGRDIESMIRDLTEIAVSLVRSEKTARVRDRVRDVVESRLLDLIIISFSRTEIREGFPEIANLPTDRPSLLVMLRAGELDHLEVELEVESQATPQVDMLAGPGMEEMGMNFRAILGSILPSRSRKARMKVRDAQRTLENEEAAKLVDQDDILAEALKRVQNDGIVFLDEIDKIVGTGSKSGPEVSREGVQRDLLPIIEGTTVNTKYGPIRTDHILFISAGAFSFSKPSDLIPEMQGRFPIRVELKRLTEGDFTEILTRPKNALVTQYRELLGADDVRLDLTDDAIAQIASYAVKVNSSQEDIGARRLHTIMEKLLEDILFDAPYPGGGEKAISVDGAMVRERLESLVQDSDMARFIL
ncbi:MAG: HslU--HslV peptidase ATPase subunit [Candidatus Wallbacteria bacterium HGW-Wallbacteria-1]|jgi:ATP-dependent HslUV protease ATP-binding subunit HslU|uniref:HslU--HslV peptidase ATPase subunit n=1 Tax=Candidatus Wallbacteria bacterium HGW-Wallbacteria-1 TaxID=2013854 RepID=A0A2N1PST7_9BACT|nr:MAG: HslU--HslV peptidase ATPase subunit [Candidatus Wallbacteria bacterium HGW-Wallbacteria-1]